jgi:hypothetical protein
MASTNAPQPDHAAVRDLDKAFTNAPALAGWLEYLAHPEEHSGPRLEIHGYGRSYESPPVEVRQKSESETDAGSVLRDLAVGEFFAAADVFTGQDIDSMGVVVGAIEELRHRKDGDAGGYRDSTDVFNSLFESLGLALPNWTDETGELVGTKYDDLLNWYQRRHEDLFVVSKRLVEYSAAIATARKNLNELMGKLVEALDRHTTEEPWHDAALGTIGNVVAFGLGKVDPTGVAAFLFSEMFAMATAAAQENPKKGGLAGDSYYGILQSFLKAARGVCDDTVHTTEELYTKEAVGGKSLKNARIGFPPVPALA